MLHSSLVAEIYSTGPHRSPFLPYVTRLNLDTGVNGNSLLFLGPTLDILDVAVSGKDLDHDPLLCARISSLSPSITQFTWRDDSEYGHVCSEDTESLAELSGSLKSLRFIDVSGVIGVDGGPVLSSLAGSPFLEEMVLWGDEENLQWCCAEAEPFPSLRRLTVLESSDDVFASFLDGLPPNLTHLQYETDRHLHMNEDLRVAVTAVSRHLQLERLVIISNCAKSMNLSLRILHPLHSCSRLRILSIVTDGTIEITDWSIALLTSHLPQLQDLELMGRGTDERHPLPSLHALRIIVTSCPVIRSISLQMDTSLARLPPDRSFKASNTLRCVDVQTSRFSDRGRVALFIEQLSTFEDFEIVHRVECRRG